MRAPRGEGGFTLVELLVAGTLAAVMVAVVLGFLLGSHRSWDRSTEGLARTQNARAALGMLNRDLRMAGSGFGGRSVVAGGIPNRRLFPLATGYGVGGDPDTLHLLGAFSERQSTTVGPLPDAGVPLVVEDATPFAAGDLVVVTDGNRANLFELSGTDLQTNTLLRGASAYNDLQAHLNWPGAGYPPGTSVVQVERVSYWVEDDAAGSRLVRRVNGGDPVPVAASVEAMTVRYEMSDGSWVRFPGDLGLVMGVSVGCVVPPCENGIPADTLTVRAQPRVRSPETTGIAAFGGL